MTREAVRLAEADDRPQKQRGITFKPYDPDTDVRVEIGRGQHDQTGEWLVAYRDSRGVLHFAAAEDPGPAQVDLPGEVTIKTTSLKTDRATLDLIGTLSKRAPFLAKQSDLFARLFQPEQRKNLTKGILAGRLITHGREVWLKDPVKFVMPPASYEHCLAINLFKVVWDAIALDSELQELSVQILSNAYLYLAIDDLGLGGLVE